MSAPEPQFARGRRNKSREKEEGGGEKEEFSRGIYMGDVRTLFCSRLRPIPARTDMRKKGAQKRKFFRPFWFFFASKNIFWRTNWEKHFFCPRSAVYFFLPLHFREFDFRDD